MDKGEPGSIDSPFAAERELAPYNLSHSPSITVSRPSGASYIPTLYLRPRLLLAAVAAFLPRARGPLGFFTRTRAVILHFLGRARADVFIVARDR